MFYCTNSPWRIAHWPTSPLVMCMNHNTDVEDEHSFESLQSVGAHRRWEEFHTCRIGLRRCLVWGGFRCLAETGRVDMNIQSQHVQVRLGSYAWTRTLFECRRPCLHCTRIPRCFQWWAAVGRAIAGRSCLEVCRWFSAQLSGGISFCRSLLAGRFWVWNLPLGCGRFLHW